MKIYAIRKKNTELFISQAKGSANTSATLSKNPRLFVKRGSATQALDCWCMGKWSMRWEGDYYGLPEPPDKKPIDRDKNDFEIVEATIDSWTSCPQ